ncbi:MAG: 5'/3'-nucleotidase SurE [Desulfovibrio sp.]|jgi:5'-nucleotidase|nr:5'/3'-nucleotidase SurE [Desulfovibrio sp.]
MKAVLTNDDGIHAVGLRAIYKALRERGHEVRVVAPMAEQSAVGHSITILSPLRATQIREPDFSGYGVFGTPTDCVKLGLAELLEGFTPDIIVSGINAGANVGPDILYSGTVAAATEAACLGFSALAVSYDSFRPGDISEHAAYAVSIMERIPWKMIPPRRIMNLNMPNLPVAEFKGVAICPQTTAVWRDWHYKREDPRGRPYWWLDGSIPEENVLPGSDKGMLNSGWATLTPLKFDFTDVETIEKLRSLENIFTIK